MGSLEEHNSMLDDLYSRLNTCDYLKNYKFIKELEYLDTSYDYRRVVGEFDICGVPDREDYLVYLEVKSSYKQVGKGRKQIMTAKEFWGDVYDIDVYGRLVLPDYDFDSIVRFLS